jgi:hypothetical protein
MPEPVFTGDPFVLIVFRAELCTGSESGGVFDFCMMLVCGTSLVCVWVDPGVDAPNSNIRVASEMASFIADTFFLSMDAV